jgi:hypothetical protein
MEPRDAGSRTIRSIPCFDSMISPIRNSSRNVSNAGEQSFVSQGLDILNLKSKKVGQMYIYADTGSTTAVFSQFNAERRAPESSAMPEMPHTVRFTHTC